MKTFIAAPTEDRARLAAVSEGYMPDEWEYCDPKNHTLNGTRDFRLIMAGMDLEESPTLRLAVMVNRASGGRVIVDYA